MGLADFHLGRAHANPELAAALHGMGNGPEVDYSRVVKHPQATERIAAAYEAMPSFDRRAIPAYKAMRGEVSRQFDTLHKLGINVEVSPHDPYDGPHAMMSDIRDNRRLRVLSTAATGSHPFFTNDQNDMFRAVHDAFGHAATGRGFDRHGEEAAYLAHARTFTPLARQAMATETRGQNSVVNVTGSFPEQKVGLLPAMLTGATPLGGRRSMFRGAVQQARDFHLSQGLT